MRCVLFQMYVTGRNLVDMDDEGNCVFFCLPSSSCIFCGWSSPAVRLLFLSCSPSPLGPMGSLWAGVAVVRGHPGYIPGFPRKIWILGYDGCCSLLLGTSPTVVYFSSSQSFSGNHLYLFNLCRRASRVADSLG